MRPWLIISAVVLLPMIFSCEGPDRSFSTMPPTPREIIDLGALVTDDLPERVWGSALLTNNGWYDRQNSVELLPWTREAPEGTVNGVNSYYTLFNHGGPHVDAPIHVGAGPEGIDGYQIDAFVGPLKVIDVSGFPLGRSVSIDVLRSHDINPGDIVLIYTDYSAPPADELPHRIALTREAAEYLAELPVRAFGTDAFNVESTDNPEPVDPDSPLARPAPAHFSFLTRGIPIYEQLFNVDQLLDKGNMYFVGVPLNIENGDGMMVRPVVLVY